MAGTLYLCATPIGNLDDMTLRVLKLLETADIIAAEDTRNTLKLLNHFEIKTPMTSYHEYNKIDKGHVLVEKLLAGAETTGAELVICNGCPVTEDGARHPLPADEQFTKDTLLDVDAFWDAFHTPWINQFTGTAHRLYAARLFDGVRYPVGLLHEDYYVLPDLIAHCSAVYCMAFTGYYVLRHAGSITDGARHEVRLAMTKGDIHRAEYFLRNGWYDRAEGALTDAALFLHDNKRAYDLTKPGHRAEFAETKRELCRVYDALAAQKGSASMKLRAAALRAGLGVFAMYVRARG